MSFLSAHNFCKSFFFIFYLIIIGQVTKALKSEEVRTYLIIIAVSVVVIAINILSSVEGVLLAFRTAFFQVTSITSTTGLATADFASWPALSKSILLFLTVMGACGGSTGGGFKVSRVLILTKKAGNEFRRIINPRRESVVTFEGKKLDESAISGVLSYFVIYILVFIGAFFLLSFDTTYGFETDFTAVIACFNNIGPGIGAVGPMGSFAGYSVYAKIILSFAMLLGRLEIYPLLLSLSPHSWTRK